MSIKLPSDNKGKTKKKKSILTCNEKQKLWDMYDSDKNDVQCIYDQKECI